MARWFSKRWVWAALAGAAVTVGMAAARGDGPPKVGAVISLNIDGKGERQFKVLKSDKQSDGTYLSELKDTKTGETITLVDKPGDPAPGGMNVPEPPKAPEPPKGKPRPAEPTAPPPAAAASDPAKEREKRTILGRIFGDKDKKPAMPAMPGPSAPPAAPAAPEPEKKPGLIGRVFGPKKPTGPSMPGPSAVDPARSSSSSPPAVIPTPPGGVAGGKLPPFPATGAPSTVEPPRVMPSKPAVPFMPPSAPSAPASPAPVPMPSSVPAFPAPSVPTPMPSSVPTPMPATPIPKPLPAFPAPTVPAPAPVPTTGGGLPPIPVPPGGTSAVQPIQVVVPVGFVPAGIAYDRDVQPFVIALQTMTAPSARLTAAKGLADGRHASSDGVKAVLFQAARMDPCGEVRAACIDHLCKLGYFSPQFLGYIQAVCEDKDPMVSASAQAACAKMLRK